MTRGRKKVLEDKRRKAQIATGTVLPKKSKPKCSYSEEAIVIGLLLGNLPGWLSFIDFTHWPVPSTIPVNDALNFYNPMREIVIFIAPLIIMALTKNYNKFIVKIKGYRGWAIVLYTVYVGLGVITFIYLGIKIYEQFR